MFPSDKNGKAYKKPNFKVPSVLIHCTTTRRAKMRNRDKWKVAIEWCKNNNLTVGIIGADPQRQIEEYNSGTDEEYLLKTFILFIIINVYFYIKDKKTSFFKIFFNTVLILSTLIYFLFKLIPGIFPELIIKASPTRFIILHSFIAWPLILSIIYFLISKLKNTKKISIITLSIVLITYSIQHNKNFVNLKGEDAKDDTL